MRPLDDEKVLDLAVRLGFLAPDQAQECREVRLESGAPPLQDILMQGGVMTMDQVRATWLAARHELKRDEDLELADFLISNNFVPEPSLRECLTHQEELYLRGEDFPALQEILLRNGLLNPQQLQIILQSRSQIHETRVRLLATGANIPSKPDTRRLKSPKLKPVEPPPPPEPPPFPDDKPLVIKKTIARPRPMVETDFFKKHKDAKQLTPALKCGMRQTRLRDNTRGEFVVTIVDVAGELDAASSVPFDEYLSGLIEHGALYVVVNGERLGYVNSGGLGVLSSCVKKCRDRGGDLRLCSLNDAVKKIVTLSGLNALLRVYDNERGVVMSYKYM